MSKKIQNKKDISKPNKSIELKNILARTINQEDKSKYCAKKNKAFQSNDISPGITAHLKNSLHQQRNLQKPPEFIGFGKKSTQASFSSFHNNKFSKKKSLQKQMNLLREKRKSFNQELINSTYHEKIQRFHTEKVSLNPSESNIIKKRRLSFVGRSTDLKKSTIQQKKKISKSIEKIQEETLYNRAVELLTQNKLKHATAEFDRLINQNSKFKSNCYLWLAICYKKQNNIQLAMQILNRALIDFPKHYEAYLYRGKLLTKLKKFQRAKKDINYAISIESEKSLAYMAKGDCLKLNNQIKQAIQAYSLGIKFEKGDPTLLYLKKIQLEYDQQQYQKCLIDLDDLLRIHPNNSEALSYKGLIQKHKNFINQAALTFQQSLKYNNSKKGVSRSLYELVKLKMQQRDYYQAYYTLSRSEHLDVDTKLIQKFKLFNEAAIFLMKRKFIDSLQIFVQLEKLYDQFDQFLRPLFHKFRAYGYFCTGKHAQAVRQYNCLDQQQKDQISIFNLYTCQGIIEVEKLNYKQGLNFFEKAKQAFPNKVEPYIYVAVTYIREVNENKKQLDYEEKQRARQAVATRALQQLNSGNLINNSNSNLLYHRAIINLYFRDWVGGLEDINRCIQKAQDNIPKYFYLRGLAYACSKDLIKAINEFSICTSLDKNFSDAYVQRAKCLFLIGDTDKAFIDLHVYMELQPKDLSIHKWIGDLLFQSKSYYDAYKTYAQIEELHENPELLIMIIKCQVRLNLIDQAKSNLQILSKITKRNSKSIKLDICVLNLLSALINREAANKINNLVKKVNETMQQQLKGEVFKLIDSMLIIATAAFYLGKYSDAHSSFVLTRQLYQNSYKKHKGQIRSEVSQDYLNINLKKILFNLFVCLVGQKQYDQAITFLKKELIGISDINQKQNYYKLIQLYDSKQQGEITINLNKKNQCSNKFQVVQLSLKNITLKVKLTFGLFHQICNQLYPIRKCIYMVQKLTPTYVEDKPQAPWIRRNPYGVVFTQNLLKNESIKLETTEIQKQSEKNQFQSILEDNGEVEEKTDLKSFKQKIKLDDQIQKKLNKMFQNKRNNNKC